MVAERRSQGLALPGATASEPLRGSSGNGRRRRSRRVRRLWARRSTPAEATERFVDAGFDHVYVHQVGPDQEGFFGFYESEVLPVVKGLRADAKERIRA
jgi:hypothetical protein